MKSDEAAHDERESTFWAKGEDGRQDTRKRTTRQAQVPRLLCVTRRGWTG